MRTHTLFAVAGLFCASMLCVSTAAADEKADKPIHEKKQTKLLEKYGDDGIDADGDGVLTRSEVKAFFKANPDLRPARHEGMRSDRHGGQKGARWGGKKGARRGVSKRGHGGDFGGDFGRSEHPGMRSRGGHAFGILEQLNRLDSEQVPDSDFLERHPRLDANGDGQLSAVEWATHVEKRREQLLETLLKVAPEIDADGDEEISDEELQVFKAAKEAEHRARILERDPDADLDGNGELSDEEFEAFKAQRQAERLQKLLERHPELDTDGDGVLSEEEARAFDRGRRGRGGGKKGFDRRGRGGGKKGFGRRGARPGPDDGSEL